MRGGLTTRLCLGSLLLFFIVREAVLLVYYFTEQRARCLLSPISSLVREQILTWGCQGGINRIIMTALVLFSWIFWLIIGVPLFLAVTIPEDLWRWAGRLKRRLRQDLERRHGPTKTDELLGPPLPYEFIE